MPRASVPPSSADREHPTVGSQMYELLAELFPICRSITGDGVRETLQIIKRHIPLEVYEVPTGTPVFDWTIPKEWNIRDAFILDEAGNKIVDFKENNLHVVGYSTPLDRWVTLEELQEHLHSIEEQPDAIPYVTSYYQERWGFCMAHNERVKLGDGKYRVVIDSEIKDGHLTYGELIIPGQTEREVFLSTYIDHPSMANNELSGPVVATFLARWIMTYPDLRYTYRIVFVPETIGSLTYLSRNLDSLKKNVIAGFNISCVGDERAYSYVRSPYGDTYADRIIRKILQSSHPEFIEYSFLERGSDERQYCSPGIRLPLVAVTRSKYGTYPEYHTSLDDQTFVSAEGLGGSYALLQDCIELIERNRVYRITSCGEPQLGRRGLYPTLSKRDSARSSRAMKNFIAYADGTNDLIAISDLINVDVGDIYGIVEKLLEADLLEVVPADPGEPASRHQR
jgi:aminopeptidase-like protein